MDRCFFDYRDGETVTLLIGDDKHPNEPCLSFTDPRCKSRASLKYQRDLANRENAPFMLISTYTKLHDPDLLKYGIDITAPMFYLTPGNYIAMKALSYRGSRRWYTPREMALFIDSLRAIPSGDKFTHLSNEYIEYAVLTHIDGQSLAANWKRERLVLDAISDTHATT